MTDQAGLAHIIQKSIKHLAVLNLCLLMAKSLILSGNYFKTHVSRAPLRAKKMPNTRVNFESTHSVVQIEASSFVW
jgi:hypothetical protein